jgi:hypothetical protein
MKQHPMQRKEAINDVRTAEGKQTEQELANAKRKLKAIQDLNALQIQAMKI